MNIKKYFEFTETINGTNYFLRQLLSSVGGFFGGFLIGYGLINEQMGLFSLGLPIIAAAIWFSLASTYKRIMCFEPEKAGFLTSVFFSLQILNTFFPDGNPVGIILTLGLAIISLYLIFANSNILNHNG
jgi:hypothetical protein